MPRTAAVNGLSISQLEQMDDRIRALGGSAGGGRARNQQSLLEVIESALKSAGGKAMSVGDITAAALKRGYRTTSANFRSIVNQALIKDKRFGSAGRGLYQLKK